MGSQQNSAILLELMVENDLDSRSTYNIRLYLSDAVDEAFDMGINREKLAEKKNEIDLKKLLLRKNIWDSEFYS